ncbi:hypothetical protein COT72_02550 [archaeon CG10_big_fil_rev_8_21_14_0_10_43_11]|nr:MAG: hypothetical protein COT72_02550 [archaeon CG10_big_fil_rev_8_21_14_0_10_43_11]
MSMRGGFYAFLLFLASTLPFSAAYAQRTTTTASGGIVSTLIDLISSAFSANPIYPIVALVVGFGIGWLAHKMIFGW